MSEFQLGLQPVQTTKLFEGFVTVPDDYIGTHIHLGYTSKRNYTSIGGVSGTINQNTITLGSANAAIGLNNVVVLQNAEGIALNARVISNIGTTVTLDKANTASFSSKTIEVFGAIAELTPYSGVSIPFNYDIFRTHDSRWGGWNSHNPAPGVFYWDSSDEIYANVLAEGREILCTLIGTPKFASVRPLENGWAYGGLGHGAEPANMQYWVDYVTALCLRYPKIKYFEVWNEANVTYTIKTATGTSGQSTIIVSDNTGLIVGQSVVGTGIGANAKIATGGISGTAITLDVANSGTVSGNITFSGQSTHFYSGTAAKLAEMTRLAHQVIKKYLPDAKVLSTAPSNIQTGYLQPTKAIGYISSDGTTITIKNINHSRPVGNNIRIRGTDNFDTPSGVVDRVASVVDANTFTITRSVTAPPENKGKYFYDLDTTFTGNYLEASTKGFSYDNNDGTGTTTLDYVDIIAFHAYQASIPFRGYGQDLLKQLTLFKSEVARIGYTKPIWATEYGFYYFKGITGTTCLVGDLTIPTTSRPLTNSLKGRTIYSPSGEVVGVVASNTGSTITLGEPAKVALTGSSIPYSDNEIIRFTVGLTLCAIAGGCERGFIYSFDHGSTGIDHKYYLWSEVDRLLNSVKGKTIVRITEEKGRYDEMTFYFSDGTILKV